MVRQRMMMALACFGVGVLALVTLTADSGSRTQPPRILWQFDKATALAPQTGQTAAITRSQPGQLSSQPAHDFLEGERLFDRETFGGNGRTCLTCHSVENGTVSPRDAQARFQKDPKDPLFVHDGSDDDDGDGFGDGVNVTRMLRDATLLMRIPLHPNVQVAGHPEIREITVRRGIPTTSSTPSVSIAARSSSSSTNRARCSRRRC